MFVRVCKIYCVGLVKINLSQVSNFVLCAVYCGDKFLLKFTRGSLFNLSFSPIWTLLSEKVDMKILQFLSYSEFLT